MNNKNFDDIENMRDSAGMPLPEEIKAPAMPLNGTLIFPFSLTPLVVEGSGSIDIVNKSMNGDRLIALYPELPDKNEVLQNIRPKLKPMLVDGKHCSSSGVLGRIVKMLKFPDNSVRVLIRGLCRMRTVKFDKTTRIASVRRLHDKDTSSDIEMTAMVRNAIKQFQEILSYTPNAPEELKVAVINQTDNARVIDLIADSINLSYSEKLAILTIRSIQERMQLLTILLNRELEVLKLGSEIQSQVHNAVGKSQREFFLREQLRTIKDELGEETRSPDIVALDARLEKLDAPANVREIIKKETERLLGLPPTAPEYNIGYTYVDWLLSLPWNKRTEDRLDIKTASDILDRDHFGLKDVKQRIIEALAVLQLKKDHRSPILCFSGPPGVGKTSLGKSIADAMGRKFVRMSLGGIKDEAEIRGHRRTYIGALPGRIIQGLKKAGTSNPVFMLDEIDKIGSDFRGDPASALLEVLDPEQNTTFNDHYIEMDYDLSGVLFIATANMLDSIPAPLLDRMDVITLPGYTQYEKQCIAEKYLVPKQINAAGLAGLGIDFTSDAIDTVINHYTREAGVRTLERTIFSVLRKAATKVVDGSFDSAHDTVITRTGVIKALGAPKFLLDEIPPAPQVGTAIGMAWTSVGGTILQIEALAIEGGKGELKLTGSLGNVMKESALAAFSYIKSVAHDFGVSHDYFKNNDFHIHVPDGATPKDGPSAGITLSTALVSLITGRKVSNRIAMTGEIQLRGRVTAVGGIKEKVIGAMRSGVKEIILPSENRKDYEEIPEDVRSALKFHFVDEAHEAWKIALAPEKH